MKIGRGAAKLSRQLTRAGKPRAPIGPPHAVFGVVTAIQSGSINTVTVRIGATSSEVVGVEHLASYQPTAGDQVYYHQINGVPFVLGNFGLNVLTGVAAATEGVAEWEVLTVTAVGTPPSTVTLSDGTANVPVLASYIDPTVDDTVLVAENTGYGASGLIVVGTLNSRTVGLANVYGSFYMVGFASPFIPSGLNVVPPGATTMHVIITGAQGGGLSSTVASGTATSGSTTTLSDSSASWTVDQWVNYTVFIVTGPGAGQYATIASNTATTLTFNGLPLPTAVGSGSQFAIGTSYGGYGSKVEADIPVTGGQSYFITVGYQGLGVNDGGGATDIRLGGLTLANRVVVAAGGGSAGYDATTVYGGGASGGGTSSAAAGAAGTAGAGGGGGATSSAGGTGGTASSANPGSAGSLGVGGAGGSGINYYGGGGGDGYYGGGGGGQADVGIGAGGGGGTDYVDPSGTLINDTPGYQFGNGTYSVTFS